MDIFLGSVAADPESLTASFVAVEDFPDRALTRAEVEAGTVGCSFPTLL